MLRIYRHIEILLLENDCIIVPGLGGFVAYYSEASYDETENLYLPPCRIVGFNPVLKMNDSLLAQSYIETYDLSYPEAVREIELEVNHILDNLAEVGYFEIGGLGTLKREGVDKIAFEPNEGGLLTPKYYALSCFELRKFNDLADALPKNNPVDKLGKKPHTFYIDTDNDGEKKLNVSIKLIKDVAVAAFLISFVFIVGFTAEKHSKIVPQEIKSGILCNIFNPNGLNKNRQNIHVSNKPVKNKTSALAPQFYWSLVLASHVTESNANAFMKKLRHDGFKEAYIYKGSGGLKVTYGRYKSAQLAADKLANLRGNRNFGQAWILKIENEI